MGAIGSELPPLIGKVFGWLDAHEVAPAGGPFWKYDVVDMDRELEVEVGVPVASPVTGDARVHVGVLPAGRYATVIHFGPYSGLEARHGSAAGVGAATGLDLGHVAARGRWRAMGRPAGDLLERPGRGPRGQAGDSARIPAGGLSGVN